MAARKAPHAVADVQIITAPNGDELVVLPREQYDRLLSGTTSGSIGAALQDEARAHADAVAAVRRGTLETLSDEEMGALLDAPTPLSFWRKKRGLTQARMAEAAGISQPYYAEIEANKKPGDPLHFKRFADALGVRMDNLVVG